MSKFTSFLKRRKSVVAYISFGAFTTILNVVVYNVFYYIFEVSNVISNFIAWLIAKVLVAFFTNKIFVFESKVSSAKGIISELISFLGCRVATGLLDIGIMYIAVDCLSQNGMVWKIISNIVIIILNYFTGKLIVFKKKNSIEK